MNKDDQIDELLSRGVAEAYPNKEAFEKRLRSGKPMRIYFGIDPTSPHLHIGHAIGLRKLRQFQDLGHEVILLLGSFTAMIGDPTDKLATRTQLTQKEVLKNASTYKEQASKILRFSGKNAAKILFNHKWLGKMDFAQVIELASHFTVQQMSERDMFKRRLKAGKPVYLHEFLYPMMQGYDSVAMDVDAEIGGSDQIFNMLAGRTLLKQMADKEKFVLALALLENDQGNKMSKTESGFIALDDPAQDMFGKLMAMDDSMIVPYYTLATDIPMEKVEGVRLALKKGRNPRDVKADLAMEVVSMFHGEAAAKEAREEFDAVFKDKQLPEDMDEYPLKETNIVELLNDSGLTSSKSEARRLIDQGAVKLDGIVVTSYDQEVGKGVVVQRGKRQFIKTI